MHCNIWICLLPRTNQPDQLFIQPLHKTIIQFRRNRTESLLDSNARTLLFIFAPGNTIRSVISRSRHTPHRRSWRALMCGKSLLFVISQCGRCQLMLRKDDICTITLFIVQLDRLQISLPGQINLTKILSNGVVIGVKRSVQRPAPLSAKSSGRSPPALSYLPGITLATDD